VAQELVNRGWTDVHPLAGGFEAWERAGYPVTAKN
jgi:rhodanese-related sulfurtransferase